MKVCLISGKAGHGKDTVAQSLKQLLEQQGEKVLIIKFGDAVKWFAREYYNYTGIKDVKERSLLQYIGTEMMRSYDKNYWGRIVSEFIAANTDFTYALIPDWRFKSELKMIKKHNKNIITVRVVRGNEDSLWVNPNMTAEQQQHISEIELDNFEFDYIINNFGTYDDLNATVQDTLNLINNNLKL